MTKPRRAVPPSEITPEAVYMRRREWIKNAALTLATAAGVGGSLLALVGDGGRPRTGDRPADVAPRPLQIERRPPPAGQLTDTPTPFRDITSYNNFYEFGMSKSDPAQYAHTLRPRPWTIAVDGEVAKPRALDIEQLLRWFPLEERIYRMRCVEAWSMVIPWVGFPLAELIKKLEPSSRAKYVAFTTLLDDEQMPDAGGSAIDFPYVEGLRIDEAMHPLTLLAVGLYGKTLPNQNGAPVRLVVPWKYGFKGIKSLVKISFVAKQPPTTWNRLAPREYGFYANVNPLVDHPRWSQATERRIGELERRMTLPFNGYADEVAGLYRGLDLGGTSDVERAAARPPMRKAQKQAFIKPGVLIGSLVPLAVLVARALRHTLGADPVAIAMNQLGLLALIFLWASLATTPLKIVFGLTWPVRMRRMLGLLAFFYATLHVLLYVVIDQGSSFDAIVADVTKRVFITAGASAYVLLIPLAATSTAGMVKRLGGARWQRLHRLAYVAAVLAALHFIWRVKIDVTQPATYALLLALLFAARLWKAALRRQAH